MKILLSVFFIQILTMTLCKRKVWLRIRILLKRADTDSWLESPLKFHTGWAFWLWWQHNRKKGSSSNFVLSLSCMYWTSCNCQSSPLTDSSKVKLLFRLLQNNNHQALEKIAENWWHEYHTQSHAPKQSLMWKNWILKVLYSVTHWHAQKMPVVQYSKCWINSLYCRI